MDKLILEVLNVPMLIESDFFEGFIHGQRTMQPLARSDDRVRSLNIDGLTLKLSTNAPYQVAPGGIAVVNISGPMFKGYGWLGYADQTELRSAIRQAAADPQVSGIMLFIDSPGGTMAGTRDLGAEIRAADAVKPVMSYIEDMGASASYYAAANSRAIYSNGGMVGSIGVVTALVDASKYYENAGVKVTPIVTGKFKGVGDPSQPVTAEHVAYVQGLVDVMYNDFVEVVAKGRGIRGESVRKLEAKVFMGEQAAEHKLIDGVMSFDKAFALLARESRKAPTGTNRAAKAKLQIEEMQNN